MISSQRSPSSLPSFNPLSPPTRRVPSLCLTRPSRLSLFSKWILYKISNFFEIQHQFEICWWLNLKLLAIRLGIIEHTLEKNASISLEAFVYVGYFSSDFPFGRAVGVRLFACVGAFALFVCLCKHVDGNWVCACLITIPERCLYALWQCYGMLCCVCELNTKENKGKKEKQNPSSHAALYTLDRHRRWHRQHQHQHQHRIWLFQYIHQQNYFPSVNPPTFEPWQALSQ